MNNLKDYRSTLLHILNQHGPASDSCKNELIKAGLLTQDNQLTENAWQIINAGQDEEPDPLELLYTAFAKQR